jgi:hypothetical protein
MTPAITYGSEQGGSQAHLAVTAWVNPASQMGSRAGDPRSLGTRVAQRSTQNGETLPGNGSAPQGAMRPKGIPHPLGSEETSLTAAWNGSAVYLR